MKAKAPQPRRRRRNSRRETLGLLLGLGCIVVILALRYWLAQSSDGEVHLQYYQKLDDTLGPDQRVVYQALMGAAPEIIGLWKQSRRWPDLAALQSEGLPPFQAALLPARLRTCQWQAFDLKDWVDYLGTCTLEGQPQAFLLRIVDLNTEVHPHPHPNYDLSLGQASQIWLFRGADVPFPISSLLEADWTWIVNRADPALKDRQ